MNTRRRRPPVLTDSSLNLALSVKYIVFSAFGFSGMITAIPSVTEVAGALAAQALGAFIGLLGIIAAVATIRSVRSSFWEDIELYSTISLIAFVSMYNACLIYLTVQGIGDRANLAIIATALLVMPVWRVLSILKGKRKAT
jgi:hypothetical protein